jgi:hypothetical protein
MLNRSSIFALAAIVTVAAAALAPTSASAMRGGFGGGGFGGGRSFGGGGLGHTASFGRIGSVGRGPVGGFGNHGRGFIGRIARHPICIERCGGHPFPPIGCLEHFKNCGGHPLPPIVWWDHPHWHHAHWGVVDGQVPVAVDTAAQTVATPTAPCNCLTKQYLDDGSVLFQDICTKEAALATPDELKAQAQGASPTQTP